jgi:hypothetical protein
MIRMLTASAAALVAFGLVTAAPEAAKADCAMLESKSSALSEKMATDMVMRREKRKINRFARQNKTMSVRVRSWGAECKKGDVLVRCMSKAKVCA